MSAVRRTSYKDYGLTEQEARFLLAYCKSDKADRKIIMECAAYSNSNIAYYLFKSVVENRSYDRLGYVPITKGDFYAYRRKLLAELKDKLITSGQLLIINGNIWSLYW